MMAIAEPCYLSALGIVNALGRGKREVASGLLRGDTSGLVEEAGWLPGRAAGRAGCGAPWTPCPAALPPTIRETPAWPCSPWRRSAPTWTGSSAATAPIASAWCSAPAPPASKPPSGPSPTTGSTKPFPATSTTSSKRSAAWLPFLAEYLGLQGPALTVSTACTSGGKALVTARNLLRLGLCDAVVTGGADSLCRLTLNGFASLESISPAPCNPMSRNRAGINVGEGAALFILRREPAPVALLGAGASSDAYHISSPDPSGAGAETAMRAALGEAGPDLEVGYLNLHATATLKNDEMESRATASVFPHGVDCSGTKPLTGHLLGASAATELAFCWLLAQDEWNPEGVLPPHRWDGQADPDLPALRLTQEGATFPTFRRSRVCMSNAFAFGGNNLSLILGPSR